VDAVFSWFDGACVRGTFPTIRPSHAIAVSALLAAIVTTPLAFSLYDGMHVRPALTRSNAGVHAATAVRLKAPGVAIVTPLPKPAIADGLAEAAFGRELHMSTRELMVRWEPLISMASRRFDIPTAWIRAVMRAESGGRTMVGAHEPITSHAGAMGLMQVMPTTYADMRTQYRLGDDPYNPHDNVFAGAAYLHWLSGKYGYPAMFAAYNDGPGHVDQQRMEGGTLPVETRNYVARIDDALGGRNVASLRVASLTRPDGTSVSVDPARVAGVRAVLPGEYASGVQAVVTIGKQRQGVRETVAQVTAALAGRNATKFASARRGRVVALFSIPPCAPETACPRSSS
jgi:hypothetical protein